MAGEVVMVGVETVECSFVADVMEGEATVRCALAAEIL